MFFEDANKPGNVFSSGYVIKRKPNSTLKMHNNDYVSDLYEYVLQKNMYLYYNQDNTNIVIVLATRGEVFYFKINNNVPVNFLILII